MQLLNERASAFHFLLIAIRNAGFAEREQVGLVRLSHKIVENYSSSLINMIGVENILIEKSTAVSAKSLGGYSANFLTQY